MSSICRPSKVPIFLMLLAFGISLWSHQALDESWMLSMPRKDEVEPEVINFTWIFESQSSKATAFLLSKGFWPLPEDWQPKMDFERHALSFNGSVPNVDSNGGIGGMNFTEPQTLWITCAEQYEECACYGKIRWGIEGRWIYIPPSTAETANRIKCEIGKQKDVPELIDVNPGDASKHCECQVWAIERLKIAAKQRK